MKKIFILISLLGSLLPACSGKKDAAPEEPAEAGPAVITLSSGQIANAGIVTGKAEQKMTASFLHVNGFIDVPPQNKVSISIPLGGYLKETKLLPGMHVSKGEVIALIEDKQYIELQQDYLAAKTKLAYLEAEFNRQKDLNQSKAASDKVFQQAQNDYSAQRILVKSLAEKLRLIHVQPDNLSENNLSRTVAVYSPIAGFVSKINVNVGKYTRPEDVLFEIVNPEDIHLVLHIFEKDISKLAIGQKVWVFTNSDPGKKYACDVILIGKNFSADRSVEVHCHFKQYDKSLIPGMYMNAEIETKNETAWTLPADAFVTSGKSSFVFVTREAGKYEMKEVQTGTGDGIIQFSFPDGASPAGMEFVLKGAYNLFMKAKNTAE